MMLWIWAALRAAGPTEKPIGLDSAKTQAGETEVRLGSSVEVAVEWMEYSPDGQIAWRRRGPAGSTRPG